MAWCVVVCIVFAVGGTLPRGGVPFLRFLPSLYFRTAWLLARGVCVWNVITSRYLEVRDIVVVMRNGIQFLLVARLTFSDPLPMGVSSALVAATCPAFEVDRDPKKVKCGL